MSTSHMSYNRDFFENFKKCSNENARLTNGWHADIKGRGNKETLCEDSEGNPLIISITDVVFVPVLKENLVFVRRLIENNLEVISSK